MFFLGKKITKKIENEIANVAKNFGFDIEYIEFVKEVTGNIFRIVLDNVNGIVSVDDCENVSRAVEEIVDKEIEKEYVLEVSSPGLERQLKNINLYKKYEGKEIFIKMYKKKDFGKEVNAILKSVDVENKKVTLEIDKKEYIENISDIASAHTIYNFSEKFKNNDEVNINELKKF